jgi:hypothetical protein
MVNKIYKAVHIIFITTVFYVPIFGMQLALPLAKKQGLMRKGPFTLKKYVQTHLVPTDDRSMKELGLCPLFDKEEFSLDKDTLAEMMHAYQQQGLSKADIQQQLAGIAAETGPVCHVFKKEQILPSGELEAAGFKKQPVSYDAPCTVHVGMRGHVDCALVQLRSLDQFELSQKTGLSPALCAGHSLNNACLIRDYAETGEVKYLKYLRDMNSAVNFLLDLTIDDWLNVEIVKANLAKMGQEFDINVSNIAAVSTVELFDPTLDKTPWFALFNPEEFTYVQGLRQKIEKGLQQENFVQIIIVGNEEVAESYGHYFAVALIKVKDKLQCVVLDTLPKVYHLQEGSHEKKRLLFLLDNIIKGKSDIILSNLRRYMLEQHGAFEQQP